MSQTKTRPPPGTGTLRNSKTFQKTSSSSKKAEDLNKKFELCSSAKCDFPGGAETLMGSTRSSGSRESSRKETHNAISREMQSNAI